MFYKTNMLVWCVVVTTLCVRVYAELFTAIADVEPLLETHQKILDDLDRYIYMEDERLNVLKKQRDIYKVEQLKAMEDIPNYLGNPINAFKLIKRLTSDLDFIEEQIKKGAEYNIRNITLRHKNVKYPTLEDLNGTAQALTRLQHTYLLEISDLSEGILNGVIYRSDDPAKSTRQLEAVSTPMSAGDCYELGRILYFFEDYQNSLSWMMEAYRKISEDTTPYPFTEVDILEYISYMHYVLDEPRIALEWTKHLLSIDPTHLRAQGNVYHFQKSIEEQKEKLERIARGELGEEELKEKGKPATWLKKHSHDLNYEALCRGEYEIPANVSKKYVPLELKPDLHKKSFSNDGGVYRTTCNVQVISIQFLPSTFVYTSFKCRYLTENHPFLKLAPIKMEQIYIDPDIMIFHEVLNDEEIEQIKGFGKHKFQRAKVRNVHTNGDMAADYRISKLSWLYNDHEPVMVRLAQRIADFTGLSLETAEPLQLGNYGIGGHYEPHYDFARKADFPFAEHQGNRIATVLFYMSDVSQGGATVFTELGLSVFPVARAAAYWLNLHPSGEGDYATRHAACPVLRGSKWVSNKWIHERGQEFIKPCNLEYQPEAIIRTLSTPVRKSFG